MVLADTIGRERRVLRRTPVGQQLADVPRNAFSVDVEDYFQVEAFKSVIDRDSWDSRPPRVEASTERVMGLLDAANVRATFFVLGWIAERFPRLVQRICERGHEIASHGHAHELAGDQSSSAFRADIRRAKSVLEDCAGVRVHGFRAPTFSIGPSNWWAYDVLAEEGYSYSSSIYPVSHDLYGTPDAPRAPFRPIPRGALVEIPISTVRLMGRNRACGGGGYFRLRPYFLSRMYIRRVNRTDRMSGVFYCHPWEFDPGQPRFRGAPLRSQVRHYLGIGAMPHRVAHLLRDFSWGRIDCVFGQVLDTPTTVPAWTP